MGLSRVAAPLWPYAAVLTGLYLFSNAWLAIALYNLGMVALGMRLDQRRGWRRLGRGWSPGPALGMMLFGAGAGVLMFLVWPWLHLEETIVAVRPRLALTGLLWPAFLIYFAAVNPWLEEYFWRGVLATPHRGISANDLLFAGYHALVLRFFLAWYWVAVAVAALAVAAWLWRRVARARDGLLVPALSHLAGDTAVVILLALKGMV